MKVGANYPEYAVRTTTTGAHYEETHTTSDGEKRYQRSTQL